MRRGPPVAGAGVPIGGDHVFAWWRIDRTASGDPLQRGAPVVRPAGPARAGTIVR